MLHVWTKHAARHAKFKHVTKRNVQSKIMSSLSPLRHLLTQFFSETGGAGCQLDDINTVSINFPIAAFDS
jgi:hypothetical protein